ncbi:transposase [Anabaena sp. UHCC 0253]|uniref:transposase n=1 Tax=Anabaena sp. UHCC 0253 TaxID=2590019 RepID=UPI0014461403|nr:transposase [Anabaena sp. UHCC 0253]MTJ53264.1 transposase [Anabaena sp. UHCC 0253]
MKYNPDIHHRQSIRLRDYDYSQPNAYFVTICTQHQECNLGEVINREMTFTVRGFIADQFWLQISNHFPNVELDYFVIMPNHVHGIIVINDEFTVIKGGETYVMKGGETYVMKGGETPPLRKKPTLGQIIAYYKYQTTKIINNIDHSPGLRIWQRNYYDRIIRNEKALNLARQYIITNPVRWDKDPKNPRRSAVSTP